jgi:MFS family permease
MTSKRIRGFFSGFSKNTFLIAAASLFGDMSTEMITPVLPIFLTQVLHASGSVIGAVDGIAQALRNFIDGFSGAISDKLRKRKAITLLGYLLGATAKPVMGLATLWTWVLAGRMLDRFGAGIRSAPRDALIVSSVDRGDRGRGFGLEGFGENAGAFLGPVLTLLLLYALHFEIRSIFYLAAIPGVLAFAIVLCVREEVSNAPTRRIYIFNPRILPSAYWRFLFVIALFSIGNSTNSFILLRTQEAGASLIVTTLIYAVFHFAASLASYALGSLSDRWGRRNLLFGSFIIFLLAYLGLFLAGNLIAIAALFILYGIFEGTGRTLGKALASDFAPAELQATGIGWFSATAGLFQLAASVIAGFLWDKAGHASVFLFGAISAAAGALALMMLVPSSTSARGPGTSI